MSLAVYALSADPITKGHLDIIERAARMFDRLIVAIGINLSKTYTFTLEERTALARQSLAHLPTVVVQSFEGLLVDFAYEVGATVLVRGVRDTRDLDFERNLFALGGSQKLELETVLLFTRAELTQVSSSAVKELQLGQGLIHEYVPLVVKQALERRLSQQVFLGVTGEIGVGKTHVTEALAQRAQANGIPVHHIELDLLGHEILEQLPEPKYQQLRAELVRQFGTEIQTKTGVISRQALAELVFADPAKLAVLNELMRVPLLVRLRRASYGKKGLILLSAALLAESDLLSFVNNYVVLVSTTKLVQQQRLAARNLGTEQIAQRVAAQATTAAKQQRITTAIARERYGKLYQFDNSTDAAEAIHKLFDTLTNDLNLASL